MFRREWLQHRRVFLFLPRTRFLVDRRWDQVDSILFARARRLARLFRPLSLWGARSARAGQPVFQWHAARWSLAWASAFRVAIDLPRCDCPHNHLRLSRRSRPIPRHRTALAVSLPLRHCLVPVQLRVHAVPAVATGGLCSVCGLQRHHLSPM